MHEGACSLCLQFPTATDAMLSILGAVGARLDTVSSAKLLWPSKILEPRAVYRPSCP